MIKSFLTSVFILLCTAIVEAAILSNIAALPSIPDLSLICVLYFSMQNGKLMGEVTGFFSGIFLDFLSAGPFGLNCLIRTAIGYVTGLFNKTISTDGIIIPAILGVVATLAKAFLLFVLSYLYPTSIMRYNPFSWLFLFELCANMILTPVIFKFLGLFKKAIVLKPESAA
ncbi:MAG: rod shape-determining protein MreD [Treponema sp.]|nr:rod shape-determining protein MreD [Treponema sp.]